MSSLNISKRYVPKPPLKILLLGLIVKLITDLALIKLLIKTISLNDNGVILE